VPRKTPVPKLDREIAARIKEFRVRWKCTRPHLAAQIGVDPETLTRIEDGRVPLKYGIAGKIFSYLPINPHWAATGRGLPKGYIILPTIEELKINANAVFSEVYLGSLLPSFKNEDEEFQLAMILRYHRGLQNADLVKKAFRDVPEDQIGDLAQSLENFIFRFLAKHPDSDSKQELQRQIWYANAKQFFHSPNAERPNAEDSEFTHLTDAETIESLPEVKAQLPNLLVRLNQATRESGRMSALAELLGVPLASVSRWLSGKREPGGEITLKLLQWVEQQERKTKKP